MSARIISFYSYKGGLGRSMTMANVAWILASNGRRVLAIDWHLDAPGLHRYFAPFLADPLLADTRGVIEFVTDYAAVVAKGASAGKDMEAHANILALRHLPRVRSFRAMEALTSSQQGAADHRFR